MPGHCGHLVSWGLVPILEGWRKLTTIGAARSRPEERSSHSLLAAWASSRCTWHRGQGSGELGPGCSKGSKRRSRLWRGIEAVVVATRSWHLGEEQRSGPRLAGPSPAWLTPDGTIPTARAQAAGHAGALTPAMLPGAALILTVASPVKEVGSGAKNLPIEDSTGAQILWGPVYPEEAHQQCGG